MYYVAYYTLPDDQRKSSPAANAKIPVIAKVLADAIGTKVEILSTCSVAKDNVKGFLRGRRFSVDENVECLQFSTYATKKGWLRRLLFWRANIKLFFKLLTVKKQDTVCFYHAIERIPVILLAKKIKKFKLVLEVEEIYSNASKLNKKEIENEQKIFKIADAYIFSTEMLNLEINQLNKPYSIIYGTYKVEEQISAKFNDGKIHCVYAGTFDRLKGGAICAVSAAEYLDENYHIHIIGFGNEEDKKCLIDKIESISKKTKCTITFDGLKTGSEYVKFMQTCHIGLSTQNPDAAFNATSFPSKVLSYMANGLRVVSIKIAVLEISLVNDLLYYYNKNTANAIACAIKSIDVTTPYDSRKRIVELYEKFKKDIKSLSEKI